MPVNNQQIVGRPATHVIIPAVAVAVVGVGVAVGAVPAMPVGMSQFKFVMLLLFLGIIIIVLYYNLFSVSEQQTQMEEVVDIFVTNWIKTHPNISISSQLFIDDWIVYRDNYIKAK